MAQVRTKLLRVTTDYFVAGAIWEKYGPVWSCVHAAPILHWMRGKTIDQAKLALVRMDATWEWL